MKTLNVRLEDDEHAMLLAQAAAGERSANSQIKWLIKQEGQRQSSGETHTPGPNGDGVRYCETCKYAWPCPPVRAAQVAVIEVRHGGPHSKSWPIVERVPGGWQSGEHHYPDKDVVSVTPR
jgi:hypothetical protein